jgi:hypothetical protein
MSCDGPESELLEKLRAPIERGEIKVSREDDKKYVALLAGRFPRYFPSEGALYIADFHHQQPQSSERLFDRFFEATGLSDEDYLTVIGESSTQFAYTLAVPTLRQYLGDFLALPQHTYITDTKADWCLCFRMEGYAGFGPATKQIT